MKLSSLLIFAGVVFVKTPVLGDITFYGVKFPSKGPVSSGVIRTSLPNFRWLSARRILTPQDLERLISPAGGAKRDQRWSVKPAIFYVSKQAVKVGKSNLVQDDAHYFLQEAVKVRMKKYRWYWTYQNSVAGRLLAARYGIKSPGTLVIFETDGSILHVEPIGDRASVARALGMLEYKHRMTSALKADLPHLRTEFKAGNVKTLVKYLQHADKHIMYASQWTLEKLSAMRRAVTHRGEQRIKAAEELAASGDRKQALAILGEIRRDYRPLSVAARAEKVARKLRRGKS